MSTDHCEPLLRICGPDIYSRNAFRLLGTDVDQKGRRIKRIEKEFQAAIEVGELAEEYCVAFLPDPLPTREELSQVARELTDAQQRFIHEFFWFWPLEWGKSASDEPLSLLKAGDEAEARARWLEIATEGGDACLVAKHNLAVLEHLLVLNREQTLLASMGNGSLTSLNECEFTDLERKQLDACWSDAFKYWDPLCRDEAFKSVLANRIRALDDPRLTTGFLRRFLTSLPIAFDNINAELAVAYCDREIYVRAEDHIEIMKATNAGDDDVDFSVRRVTGPLHDRIDHAVTAATTQLAHKKEEGKKRSTELFSTVQSILHVLRTLLGEKSQEYIETCDRVAESMLQCQVAYGNATQDWKTSALLLEDALKISCGAKARGRIEENLKIVRNNRREDVCWFCEERPKDVEHNIEVAMKHAILWREIKGNPKQYREALLQLVKKVSSDFTGMGSLNGTAMFLRDALQAAAGSGDPRAIVSALDPILDDSKELMSREAKATVPRCRICGTAHSREGAAEKVDVIQKKLEAATGAVEREAEAAESLEKEINSRVLVIRKGTWFLRGWLLSRALKSLRGKQQKCNRRHQKAKMDRARWQNQLAQNKAEGTVKPYKHIETWHAVAEAKVHGFHISSCDGVPGAPKGAPVKASAKRADQHVCRHCGRILPRTALKPSAGSFACSDSSDCLASQRAE